jgi:hypothetical protein
MRKFVIGATTALATMALAGGVASAQVGQYTFGGDDSAAATSLCSTAAADALPVLNYAVTFNQVLKGEATLTLNFENGTIGPFPFTSPTGQVTFPTTAGHLADGWTIVDDEWVPGPSLTMTVVITDLGDGNATYTSEPVPVVYDETDCPVDQAPPNGPPNGPNGPPNGPNQPGVPLPPPNLGQQPPPGPPTATLPRSGMSTFETGMRTGALLLVAGLAFVIVARRRRISTAPTSTSTSTSTTANA